MSLNTQHQLSEIEPLMTEIVSLRLTQEERSALERLACREDRTIRYYVRKQLRSHLEQQKGRER